ncbi:MAG TPA: DNA repair protein RadC [Ideonella sp.]|uniref:RadC family protein n=1 Tax=Ideonella sp. TaxID=1929293 RepID=UPI002C46EBCC|nr:DNA repair protein RadC [Ideonella sp.]HSI47144.1 DNA repair protein RadC [Ideonella sp.]
MDMKDMPAALRPREKLLAQGPAALADTELLALLLRTGIQGKGVLAMAGELLASFDGFGGLLQASADDFRRVKGLGPAKRAELAAVMEMARRALLQPMQRGPVFDSPGRVKDFVSLQLARREQEVFGVLFLDSQHRLIEWRELFHGTLSQTSVYPREIVKQALALNAGALILAHNHPSGLAEPSKADEYLTQSLKAALQMVDVRVLDHLVVGAGQVVSFAERGLI